MESPSLQKFIFKVKGPLRKYKKNDMLLPLYKVDDKGPRVLVILDRSNKEDTASGRLLDNETSGVVFENLLRFVSQRCEKPMSQVLVCNYEYMNTHQIVARNAGLQEQLDELYARRINKMIKSFEPDRVLIMGQRVAEKLAPYPKLKNNDNLTIGALNGRVRTVKYGKKKIKTVTTHSLSIVSNDFQKGPEDFKRFPNLLGEVGHHFENCASGKNRYNVDISDMEIKYVDTISKFDRFFEELNRKKHRIGFDTEGDNLQRINNTLFSMQFTFDGKLAYFIPLSHPESPFDAKELAYIYKKMKWWCEFGKSKYLIGNFLKHDVTQFRANFKARFFNHKLWDIAAGEYCLDENRKFRSNLGLGAWGLEQIGMEYGCTAYLDDDGSMKKSERENMRTVSLKRMTPYGCFAGNQKFITREYGSIEFEKVVGKKVHILNDKGKYEKANIKNFGIQNLQEIEFCLSQYRTKSSYGGDEKHWRMNGKSNVKPKFIATPDHRWYLEDGTVTRQLKVGDRVKANASFNFDKKSFDYQEGMRHGIIFGDGSLLYETKTGFSHQVYLYLKKQRYAKLFSHTTSGDKRTPSIRATHNSTINMKNLPPKDMSINYYAGFIKGLLVTDTHKLRNKYWVFSNTNMQVCDWLRDNAPLGGWVVTGDNYFERKKFKDFRQLSLTKTKDICWAVKVITRKKPAPVYCAVVKGSESFTLSGGVYTGNCKDVCVPYRVHECQLQEAYRRGDDYAKFPLVITELISDIILHFSEMELNGLPVDRKYLIHAMGQNSPFVQLQEKIAKDLRANKDVQKANRNLLKERGAPTRTLAGSNLDDQWVFDISKEESQQELFFNVLGLEILEERKNGGGKINKDFQKANEGIPLVDTFSRFKKVNAIKNAYIDGFFKKITTLPDMADGHLRPHFLFLTIITGRAGAEKPSLQQIPEHGELAEAVKRQFITHINDLYLKADYSAHEVRGWAQIAKDDVLAAAFRVGMTKRQRHRLLKFLDAELAKKWEDILKGADIHRTNYEFFFKVPAAQVDKVQRQSIKGVVFGVIYGKGAKSLAEEIKSTEEAAKKLINLLFSKFDKGGDWIKDVHTKAKRDLTVVGPLGRVRHLWGYLHWDRGVHAAMNRRGPNSIIQGTGSDEGFIAGRILKKMVWNLFVKKGRKLDLKALNAVHDSTENSSKIWHMPIACYLLEHAMTTQLAKHLEDIFGFKINIDFEVEIAIGPSLGKMFKWDFRKKSMKKIVQESVEWQAKELGYEPPSKKEWAMFQHNLDIVSKLRRRELKKARQQTVGASHYMILNSANVKAMGFQL